MENQEGLYPEALPSSRVDSAFQFNSVSLPRERNFSAKTNEKDVLPSKLL